MESIERKINIEKEFPCFALLSWCVSQKGGPMNQVLGIRSSILAALSIIALFQTAWGEATREQLTQFLDSDIREWRWHLGEAAGAEKPGFDDSQWQPVTLGFQWYPHDSTGWFRTQVTIPEYINGISTKGAAIRMRAGVDNGAKAYVNGKFKQEFEWAKGDFVLTEHAEPGEVIVVALHAVNRPGMGSLYQAYLVNGAGEALVDALRALLKEFDAAVEDGPYVPAEEASHWRGLVQEALQSLDLEAYQAGQGETFLKSVEAARAVLQSDRASLEKRLEQTEGQLVALQDKIRQQKELGQAAPYQTLDARVVESYLQYVRDDLADKQFTHQLRGLKAAAYIERLCTNAFHEIEKSPMGAPRYATAPCLIHDGAFWQKDRPVYFTGVGHFGQVKQDIPILNEYGLNIIQIEMGPRTGLPDPNTVDRNAIQENVVQWLDKAAGHHVAVNLLISPHYFPQWAIDVEPAHKQCGEGFLKYCIEAPNTRVVMEKWLDALMPQIAHHPALHSICLSNEPQYRGKCAYDRAQFQAWLKEKWGGVRKMNKAYGTHFRCFEDVELPKDASSSYGYFFDACRFNQERFLAFHEMLRDRIHRHDPDVPVHVKIMSHAFEDPGRFEVGIDYERYNQVDRIAGNDCVYGFNGAKPGGYACDWLNMAMSYTLQHSTASDSPIFNSENHLIPDGDARYMPEAYIRTVYWHEALHGQGATTTWVWERAQEGDFSENILTRANCVRSLGRVALDLNRLAPEVHALSRAKGEVAIFYAYSSLLPSMEYVLEAKAAYEGMYFTDAVCDFVTERQIETGAMDHYKLVIVPHATHAPEAVVKAFQTYIEKGGAVMIVGPCFTHDEYGRSRKHGLEQAGSGRLVVYPDALSPNAYRDILGDLLDEIGVVRPVRLEGSYKEPVWGVNLRAVQYQGKMLVNLLNLTREPKQVCLIMNPPVRGGMDLITNQECRFPFQAIPMEPVLIALDIHNE